MTVWVCHAWNVKLAYEVEIYLCLNVCCNATRKVKKKKELLNSSLFFRQLVSHTLCFNRFVKISLQNSAPLISTITILRHRGSCLFSNINARYCHIIYFLLLFRFIFENIARLSERLSLIFIGSGYWIGIREMALKYIYIYIFRHINTAIFKYLFLVIHGTHETKSQ